MTLNRSAQRLSRLLTLVSTLSETSRALTARELRDKIEGYADESDQSFHANFSRDKRELRDLGIEIEVVDLDDRDPPEQGYRISRANYALRDPGLDPDEAAALQLAVSLVRLDGLGAGDDLWKIGGGAPAPGAAGATAALPGDPTLAVLFDAVAQRRVVTFGYRSSGIRRVEPYRLQFARSRWYLLARDQEKGGERQFRLDRIDGVPEVGPAHAFAPPTPDQLAGVPDPWSIPEAAPVTARLAVHGPQAALARRMLGEEAVVDEDGDRTTFEMQVSHVDGFRSFVLGFLEHAEVLEPPELRAAVVEWLEDLA